MFQPVWEMQCFDNIWFNPPRSRVFIRSLAQPPPSSLMFIPERQIFPSQARQPVDRCAIYITLRLAGKQAL